MAKEAESNRIIIWRMDPVAWEGDGQVFVGTLEVINCGAIDGLMRVWNWAFKSNNSLDLGRGEGKYDSVIYEDYNGP